MITALRPVVAGLVLLVAAPALAQFAPPPREAMRPDGSSREPGPFALMSETGRRLVHDAFRSNRDADRADRDRVDAARDRMLAIVDAERLDVAAMRRAMDDEREASQAIKARRQATLYAVMPRLTPADRHLFVEGARTMRAKVAARIRAKGNDGEEFAPR